jgi:hypothetical protein
MTEKSGTKVGGTNHRMASGHAVRDPNTRNYGSQTIYAKILGSIGQPTDLKVAWSKN